MMLASHPATHFASPGLKEANMRAKWLTRAEKSPPENFPSLTSDKSSAKVRSIHAKPCNTQQRNMGVEWRPPPMLTEIDMLGLPDSHSLMKGLALKELRPARRIATQVAGQPNRRRAPIQPLGPGLLSNGQVLGPFHLGALVDRTAGSAGQKSGPGSSQNRQPTGPGGTA